MPLGISEPDGDDQAGTPDGPDDQTPSPGDQPANYPPSGETPRVDDSVDVMWMERGGVQHGPRGRRVRHAYALYRPFIYQDNGPEAMLAFGRGEPRDRAILQVWHSNRYGETGRQILFRAWDGFGRYPRTGKFALGTPQAFGQWPAVLALPERRALVVWEEFCVQNPPPEAAFCAAWGAAPNVGFSGKSPVTGGRMRLLRPVLPISIQVV